MGEREVVVVNQVVWVVKVGWLVVVHLVVIVIGVDSQVIKRPSVRNSIRSWRQ